jgi:hypothetical protein
MEPKEKAAAAERRAANLPKGKVSPLADSDAGKTRDKIGAGKTLCESFAE